MKSVEDDIKDGVLHSFNKKNYKKVSRFDSQKLELISMNKNHIKTEDEYIDNLKE